MEETKYKKLKRKYTLATSAFPSSGAFVEAAEARGGLHAALRSQSPLYLKEVFRQVALVEKMCSHDKGRDEAQPGLCEVYINREIKKPKMRPHKEITVSNE